VSTQVRTLFASIARSYDRANQVLSLGLHHRWRTDAVRRSGAGRGDRVLDCATGTGDFALAFRRAVGPEGDVVGVDFCAEILALAPAKALRRRAPVRFQVADVLALPFPDGAFDVASIAFGIRNVDDPARGLSEMARVVRPGGRVVVLEFGQPRGALFGPAFRWYSRHVIPRVGGLLSGDRGAYEYLDRTAARFPSGESFVELLRGTGRFRSVAAHPLTGGVAFVYVGEVAAPGRTPARNGEGA
jgi:demethylmenaquinone methyltransferase/2-methoxy-6-polyprenyl-1,4-benzoquinol methylase